MRRRASAGIGLAVLLLLAGCVSIPTSGGVQSQTIDSDPDVVPNVALPEGPVDGQSPLEIVQGFLSAGQGPQGNYQVAKEFLAPGTDWNGTSRVLVVSSGITAVEVDDDTFATTVTVIGEVDAGGRYSTIPAQSQTLTYDVTEVDGQFRISRADPGTVLRVNGFANAFAAYPLYFFDPSFELLVPDLRWFPVTRTAANRIVGELLAGPSPWLGSGVLVSAFPDGTQGRATFEAPRVDVVLDADVRAESVITQLRMQQQLDASLDALGNVADVVIRAGDLPLAPASDDSPPESAYPVRDSAIGGADGRFGVLAADGVVPLTNIGTRVDALEPVGASLARDRESVAVLGAAGVSVVDQSGDTRLVDDRAGLIAPSLDPHGFVWSVPRGDPGGLIAVGDDGIPLSLPLDVDGEVVSMSVARDGARLLVAVTTPTGPRVMVIGIQRNADLVPVVFGGVFDLPVHGVVVDAAWVDGTHVAVLWSGAAGTGVESLALGGPIEDLGDVDDGIAIVGGNGDAGLRVLSADGMVLRPSGAGGWRDTGLVASFLGTQQ